MDQHANAMKTKSTKISCSGSAYDHFCVYIYSRVKCYFFIPVEEESILTETIVEEIPIRYQIVQKGSQRGQKLLVDSLGYFYGVKVN